MKIKSSCLMSPEGTIDGYVVYTWRGQRCLRNKRRPPEGPLPRGLVAQQERIASVAVFYQALREAGLYPYWQEAARDMVPHGYNLLTRANLPAFGEDGTIRDFTKLRPTPDLMPLPDGLTLEAETEGTWRLTWDADGWIPGTADDDLLRLLAMRNADSFTLNAVDAGGAMRSDGEARFSLPGEIRDNAHLFVIFCSRTGAARCTSGRYYNLNTLKTWPNIKAARSRGI